MNWRTTPTTSQNATGWLLTGVIVGLCMAVIGSSHKASALISVQQTIVPKDCQVRVVERAGGTYRYSLPPRCGQLVLSAEKQDAAWLLAAFHVLAPLSLQPSPQIVRLLYEPQPTYLASKPDQQPLGGYVLVAQPGERYGFNLAADLPGATAHVLQVQKITDSDVTIQFWPGGRTLEIPLDGTRSYQDTKLPVVDMKLALMQLNADGSATIRLQFPVEPWYMMPENDSYSIVIAGALLVGMVSIALNMYIYDWLLIRRDAPPEDWWVLHHHEPFDE